MMIVLLFFLKMIWIFFKNKQLVLQGKHNKTDGLWDVPVTPTVKNHDHSINFIVHKKKPN